MDNPTDEDISKAMNNIFNNEITKNVIQKMTTSLQEGDNIGITIQSAVKNISDPITINSLQKSFLATAQQPVDNNKILTRSENVKIFTEESKGEKLPSHPRKMTRDEVLFLVKMVSEELQELLLTVTHEDEDVKNLLVNIVTDSNSPTYNNLGKSDLELMAEQVDAFVDIDYYNCNAAAKVGFNVDDVFDLVHQANMNKKFEDGTFHKNSEGKVIKPPGWVEPDVKVVISKWIENGTWTKK
jgi:predicted HAD superfamily Cof-like phosphohydrolase